MQKTQQTIPLSCKNSSGGFTLIEILVSLLIQTIGIISFALLQVESLRATHNAMQRTKAIHFSNDMMERISANTLAVSEYGTLTGTSPASCSASLATPIDCTAVQIANYDIWQWNQALANDTSGIVNGTGAITVTNASSPYNVDITISWNDRDETNSYTLSSVVLK